MDKVTLDIVEKGTVCELKKGKDQPGIEDDCEKLLYLALAEANKRPTRIQIKGSDGTVKRTIFVPENLHVEEVKKRDELFILIGNYMKEVVQLPKEVYGIYQDYVDADDIYDHLLHLLEAKGWGSAEHQQQMKFDRGDEIQKRDNIISLTADLFDQYGLAPKNLIQDFRNYPDKFNIDQLSETIQMTIDQKDTEMVIVYVVDNPGIDEDLNSGLLPVFVEEDGHLKIVAWISPEVIPQNLLPVFDIEQNLIGWLDSNKQQGETL